MLSCSSNIVYVYKAIANTANNNIDFNQLLNLLPKKMHKRALRYKFKQDAYNFIVGRLLLKTGLKQLELEDEFNNIKNDESGKPTLSKVFFNISHSQQYVICALSLTAILGVDIEMHQTIDLNNFNQFFTEKEWRKIEAAKNSTKEFYWYWTRKESIIKALGKNLNYLHQIEIDASQPFFYNEKQKWHLKNLSIAENSTTSICSSKAINVKLIKMDLDNFKNV